MANLNCVLLMGNLTRDPQLSYLQSQTPVVEFGLAINRTFKKQDGSQGQEVCFVDVQMFGNRAEVINKYFKKGSPIFIEGRLKFDQWQDQQGQNRTKLRVLAENFEFIGGNNNGGQQQNQQPGDPQQNYQQPQGHAPQGCPPQNNNQGNYRYPQQNQQQPPQGGYYPNAGDDIPF